MKVKFWTIAGGAALMHLCLGFMLIPQVTGVGRSSAAINPGDRGSVPAPFAIAQASPVPTSPTPNTLGQDLLREVVQCAVGKIQNPQQASMEVLQAASTECMYSVVILDANGKVRPDANERMTAVIAASGVKQPKPTAQGQATLQLKRLPGKSIFTVPIAVGGKPEAFLFDTGASMSIVDTQLAKQLKLSGTALPKGIMQNFAVGKNCADVSVMLHPLPPISAGTAKVTGITGVGLPKASIPGDVAGVLGIDFLSGFDVVLNPKTAQLKLLPPSAPVKTAIPLVGKFGLMTTQVYVNGQGPFTVALDTGAEWTVISDRLAQRLSLNPQKAPTIDLEGFCGTEKGKRVKLAELRLQNYRATQIDTAILNNDLLDIAGVDGIVGQNFLNRYQQHWRFGQPDALGLPREGSLGLSPLLSPNGSGGIRQKAEGTFKH